LASESGGSGGYYVCILLIINMLQLLLHTRSSLGKPAGLMANGLIELYFLG